MFHVIGRKALQWKKYVYSEDPSEQGLNPLIRPVEKDCALWLEDKGRLKKEDQQYGEWLRTDQVRPFKKTVVVVFDCSHVPCYWKKGPSMEKNTSTAKTPMNKVLIP